MAIFEGPDKNRNIIVAVVLVVIVVVFCLYSTGKLPGM